MPYTVFGMYYVGIIYELKCKLGIIFLFISFRFAVTAPSYLHSGPPVLLHPDKVVPHSESSRLVHSILLWCSTEALRTSNLYPPITFILA